MSSQPIDPTSASCGGGVPAVLTRMRQTARGLGDTLWAARGPDELMDTVAEIEALKSAADALLLGVIRELEVTGAVKDVGWASTQDFLTAVAGGHKGTGPATLRLASAVDQPSLAPVGAAMAQGWLSTTKAHLIERAIDTLPSNPGLRERGVPALLAEANGLDATELRKVAGQLVCLVDPDGDERRAERELDREERAAHLGRHLAIRDDGAAGPGSKAAAAPRTPHCSRRP